MSYTQLTIEERTEIYSMLQRGFSEEKIALRLRRHRSTIYRELKRNCPYEKYSPILAQHLSHQRKKRTGYQKKFTPALVRWIESGIKKKWSPDQVRGRLFLEAGVWVSTEWIYSHIKKDRNRGGTLWTNLRQSHRKKRRRFGRVDGRSGPIKNRVFIDERPPIVNDRSRIGDLEGDTLVGRNHKGAVLNLCDRVSLKVGLKKLESKHSHICAQEAIKVIKKFNGKKHTLTFDNGAEFAGHRYIQNKSKIQIYFAHPYTASERGTNENLNGLIRQYLPKKTDFKNVNDHDLNKIETALNSRPRRCLCYLTPNEFHDWMVRNQERTATMI
jgi:transposase, IS30 family